MLDTQIYVSGKRPIVMSFEAGCYTTYQQNNIDKQVSVVILMLLGVYLTYVVHVRAMSTSHLLSQLNIQFDTLVFWHYVSMNFEP